MKSAPNRRPRRGRGLSMAVVEENLVTGQYPGSAQETAKKVAELL
ncbi:hypothetical protein [Nocardia testacea]